MWPFRSSFVLDKILLIHWHPVFPSNPDFAEIFSLGIYFFQDPYLNIEILMISTYLRSTHDKNFKEKY